MTENLEFEALAIDIDKTLVLFRWSNSGQAPTITGAAPGISQDGCQVQIFWGGHSATIWV